MCKVLLGVHNLFHWIISFVSQYCRFILSNQMGKCFSIEDRCVQHDVPLNFTRGKRITTNCASLWAYIQEERPDLAAAYIDGISCPGQCHAAHQAAQDFATAITMS